MYPKVTAFLEENDYPYAMNPSRIEAFSDAVIAIIITIMVLSLDVPSGHTFASLHPLVSVFANYLLSFVYLGVYWNNHHHLIRSTRKITGGILWANLHLLFWLSLFPFFTGWVGSSGYAKVPTFMYGCDLLGAAIAYFILQQLIIKSQGEDSSLKRVIGRDIKGKLSPILYSAGIAFSLILVPLGIAFYVIVAIMWVIPDRRLENYLASIPEES